MKILITGTAGFIGFHIAKKLLHKKSSLIIGIDNLDDYYDIRLKKERLKILNSYQNFYFHKANIQNYQSIESIFKKFKVQYVVHLAAQAGVRYSIDNPRKYLDTNINGFFNILDISSKNHIKHFIYASTSSVYGDSNNFPLTEKNLENKPLSFYAATKLSNEVMAYSYSNIHSLPTTGLRFFTVYGPFGRPDMALFKFAQAIINEKEVMLFNNGNHIRDFTYIDDVVDAIEQLLKKPSKEKIPSDIFNIASSKPERLKKFIELLEKELGKKAKVKKLKLQIGDIYKTHASISQLKSKIGFKPVYNISKGVSQFVKWFKTNYYS